MPFLLYKEQVQATVDPFLVFLKQIFFFLAEQMAL